MIAVNIVLAVVTFLKGKLTLGMFAVFVPLVGLFAAVRLAKPRSLWAKRFYRDKPAKLERARARYEAADARARRLHNWFDDLIGGAPTFTSMPFRMEVVGGRLMIRTEPATRSPETH